MRREIAGNNSGNTYKKYICLVAALSVAAFTRLHAETGAQQLGEIDLLELTRSSFVMVALFILSVVTLTFIVERFLYFKKIGIPIDTVMKTSKEFLKNHAFEQLIEWCESHISPLTVTIKAIVENRDKSKADLEEITEIIKMQQKSEMEKFMVILSSAVASAPLLGLLGTVMGIIKAFADLAKSGTGGPAVVASGVSEALVTTAFGLVVAIPALFVFNFFSNKIRRITAEMETNSRIIQLMIAEVQLPDNSNN